MKVTWIEFFKVLAMLCGIVGGVFIGTVLISLILFVLI